LLLPLLLLFFLSFPLGICFCSCGRRRRCRCQFYAVILERSEASCICPRSRFSGCHPAGICCRSCPCSCFPFCHSLWESAPVPAVAVASFTPSSSSEAKDPCICPGRCPRISFRHSVSRPASNSISSSPSHPSAPSAKHQQSRMTLVISQQRSGNSRGRSAQTPPPPSRSTQPGPPTPDQTIASGFPKASPAAQESSSKAHSVQSSSV